MGLLNTAKNAIKRRAKQSALRAGKQLGNEFLNGTSADEMSVNPGANLSKLILIIIISIFLLISAVVAIILRGIPATVGAAFNYIGSKLEGADTGKDYSSMTAKQLYDILEQAEKEELALDDELVMIDSATLKKILKRVSDRNSTLTSDRAIEYEYRLAEGLVLSFDEITGAYTLGPKTATHTEYETVETVEKVKEYYTHEEISAYVKKEYTDKGIQPPPREALSGMYHMKDVVSTEIVPVEVEETIDPKEYTFKTTVNLSRSSVERDDYVLGDIFDIRWQAVLALTSMYVEMRVGTDEEAKWGYSLTDDEINAIVDIFAFDYYFYDDPTLETSIEDFSYNCHEDRVYAYKLKVDPNIVLLRTSLNTGQYLDTLRVYHEPSIAPRMIVNTYLKYVYEYDTLANGYMVLSGRKMECNPQGFVDACSRLIEEFDLENFYEHLELVGGAEDVIAYYKALMEKGYYAEEVTDTIGCPLIGTILSMSESKTAYAKKFSYNTLTVTTSKLTDEDITINVSYDGSGNNFNYGGTYGGTITGLSDEVLSDPFIRGLVESAEKYMGTPYKWGGKVPGGFDCSGFVCWILNENGVKASGGSVYMWQNWVIQIDKKDRRPGDLVFFHFDGGKLTADRKKDEPTHVGLYLGDDYMVHCSEGKGVNQFKLSGTSYDTKTLGYGRIPGR